jgi:hypothetical protein
MMVPLPSSMDAGMSKERLPVRDVKVVTLGCQLLTLLLHHAVLVGLMLERVPATSCLCTIIAWVGCWQFKPHK